MQLSETQRIKQRFGIIGNAPALNRAIDIAVQVSSTDLSVLITGESGVGKETFPQIIHQYSRRKHNAYTAVNCGAIPEEELWPRTVRARKRCFYQCHIRPQRLF